jgi:uncharacterized protein YggE
MFDTTDLATATNLVKYPTITAALFFPQRSIMNHGILRVTEKASAEITAIRANLHITVEGEHAVFGNAALDKAKELKALVAALRQIPDFEFEIVVKSVRIHSQSGWLSKSSRGVYSIVIQCHNIAAIGDVLGAIAGGSNISMTGLEWVFDEDKAKIELIRAAMSKCLIKATNMAEVVKHEIVQIHSASDSWEVPNTHLTLMAAPAGAGPSGPQRGERASADIGTEFKGTQTMTAVASVEFLIKAK